MIRTLGLAAALLLFSAGAAADNDATGAAAAEYAAARYGKTVHYAVTRNGVASGIHRLYFSGDVQRLTVVAETRATMRILGLFDMPFIYDSRAVWADDVMLTLSASFNRGGSGGEYWLAREERQDSARYRTSRGEAAAPLFPTNHWHRGALRQRALFNTLNGKLSQVRIVDAGLETIQTGDGVVAARRFDVSGDLDILLWYGDDGRWLQLRFSFLGGDYLFTHQKEEGDVDG